MAGAGKIVASYRTQSRWPEPTWRRPRRRRASRLASTVAALAAFAAVALPIHRDAAAALVQDPSVAQVVARLRVDQTPADYVVLVDVSSSMTDSGLYPQVQAALQPFLDALDPVDHLSLITFDTVPDLRFSGTVGERPDRSLAQLPRDAVGEGTDIGTALEAALAELERPDAYEIGALILLTDGKIAAPGSRYAELASPAWSALAARAARRAGHRAISSYAVGLGGGTDAGAVHRVLPNTIVVSLPAGQVTPYLVRVKDQLRLTKARELLRPDLGNAVTARWSGSLDRIDLNNGGTATAELTLTSTFQHLPVTVSGLRVVATGL
ncbi:MAG: VWA domain-containing protein, partial [Mycobacteriales bacterium]